jgi:hypothetical protein
MSDRPLTATAATEPRAKCACCRSDISKDATVCPFCRADQNAFRRWLVFLGGIAGFLVLMSSLVIFVFGQIRTLTAHPEITVAELRYPGSALVVNSGGARAELDSLDLYFPDGSTKHALLREAIGANSVVRLTTPPNYVAPKRDDDVLWQQSPGLDHKIEETALSDKSPCVRTVVATDDNPVVLMFSQWYAHKKERLLTLPVHGSINYSLSTTGTMVSRSQDNLEALFVFVPLPGCNKKDWIDSSN